VGITGVSSVFPDAVAFLDAEPAMGDMEMLEAEVGSIANPAGGFRYSYQWNLRQIGADAAWAAGMLGSPDVSIAILDTGIDYNGYDMAGMVDLDRSASFVPNDDAILAFYRPGRHVIDDMNGHGSNVANQASSNATIFAGVNSRARLIGVKVLGYNGSGSLAGILAGLEHSANVGADVANMSLGVRFGVDKSAVEGFMGLTNRAFNYANRMGMVVVVSAGNDTINMDNGGAIFRAYCEAPHVICVAATGPTSSTNAFTGPWDETDAPAAYTNFGRQDITVAAPGGTSRGWVASVCARGRITQVVGGQPVFGCNAPAGSFFTTGYAGTSQAAPHVAGVVAQLIAKHGKRNPSQIKHILIKDAVDDLGPRGKDAYYGHGRVNVAKALGL
jgi:lantibiotic leader peptide-processing serine protease